MNDLPKIFLESGPTLLPQLMHRAHVWYLLMLFKKITEKSTVSRISRIFLYENAILYDVGAC